ncbi:ankyrin repeat-containing domain protein, partial [Baffinella frigidus]
MEEAAPVLRPALWRASLNGHTEEVRRLLAEGADIEGKGGEDECTPLLAAAQTGNDELVLLLLEKGANVSARDNNGWNSLLHAAHIGREGAVRALLNYGAVVSEKDDDGWTALHCAASEGHEAVSRLLLAKGAELSA